MLVVLTRVMTWLQVGIITNFSGKTLTHLRWPLARWRSVLFTDNSRFQLYRPDGSHLGERFADVTVVNRVPHGGGGFMVLAGISYGRWTHLYFIDGNLMHRDPEAHCHTIHPPPSLHVSAW
jgi:hypothetical protein